MIYKTEADYDKELETLKGYFSQQPLLATDESLNDLQLKPVLFETEELVTISKQLSFIIQTLQDRKSVTDFQAVCDSMKSIALSMQKIQSDNITELHYINSLLDKIDGELAGD